MIKYFQISKMLPDIQKNASFGDTQQLMMGHGSEKEMVCSHLNLKKFGRSGVTGKRHVVLQISCE